MCVIFQSHRFMRVIGLNGHRWLRSDFFTWLELFLPSRISRAVRWLYRFRSNHGKSNQKLKAHREKDGKGAISQVVTILNE